MSILQFNHGASKNGITTEDRGTHAAKGGVKGYDTTVALTPKGKDVGQDFGIA